MHGVSLGDLFSLLVQLFERLANRRIDPSPPLRVFQDINSIYQIFPDEVLGSGQFGVVYGGERQRGCQGLIVSGWKGCFSDKAIF